MSEGFYLISQEGCDLCKEAKQLLARIDAAVKQADVNDNPDAAADFDWFDNGSGLVPMLIVEDPDEGEHALQGGQAVARLKKEIHEQG